jgi:NAD(P)-dependent dehydrogenase (short-subunit alcohol dehydrogenase family)
VNPSQLPDQTGKVIVITGATSGIGLETAVALAGAGATVVVSSRNPTKVETAVAEVR